MGACARVRGVEAAELALEALGRVSAEEMAVGELEELSATLGRVRTRTSDLLRAVASAAARDSKSVDAVRLLGGRAGLANREVRRMKRVAERLEEMPNTSERLRSASITFEHAAALADAAAECGAKTVDNDPRLLELAEKVPIDQYSKETRSFAGKHAPDRGKARLNWQRRRRQASLYTEESTGMGVLRALFDPISFNLLRQTIDRHTDALWRKDGGREGRPETLRTPQQRTCDAIYELLTGKPAPAHKPKKQEKPQQPAETSEKTTPPPKNKPTKQERTHQRGQQEEAKRAEEPTPTRPSKEQEDTQQSGEQEGLQRAEETPPTRPAKEHDTGQQPRSSDQTRRQHGRPRPKEQNAGAQATTDGTTTDPAPPPNRPKEQERTHQRREQEGLQWAEETPPTRPPKEQNTGQQPGTPTQAHRPEQAPTQQTEEPSADRAGKPASIQSPDASDTASKDVRNNKATNDSITEDTHLAADDTRWFKAKNASQLIVVADIGILDGTNPHGRCEILGTGPVPPDILQELTPDTELASIIFAGNGQPLWLGRSRRLANDHQRLAVAARDSGCVLCGAPMHLCEIHHIKEWNTREGPTDIENLAAICGHHHRWLHNNNQQLIHSPDNGTWTTKPRPPKQPPPQRPPPKQPPGSPTHNPPRSHRTPHQRPPAEQATRRNSADGQDGVGAPAEHSPFEQAILRGSVTGHDGAGPPAKHSPTGQPTNQLPPACDGHGEPPPQQAMSEQATITYSQARHTEQKPTRKHNPQARENQRPPPGPPALNREHGVEKP